MHDLAESHAKRERERKGGEGGRKRGREGGRERERELLLTKVNGFQLLTYTESNSIPDAAGVLDQPLIFIQKKFHFIYFAPVLFYINNRKPKTTLRFLLFSPAVFSYKCFI